MSSTNDPKNSGKMDVESEDEDLDFTKKIHQRLLRRIQELENGQGTHQNISNENAAALVALGDRLAKNQELTNRLQRVNNDGNPVQGKRRAKLPLPRAYDGTSGKLEGFLAQVKVYHRFYEDQFLDDTDRVIHAGSLLAGKALDWFQPYLTDYTLSNESFLNCKDETVRIFRDMNGFEEALRMVYQDPDEKQQAESELMDLKQTHSASSYLAEFRRLTAKLDMTEETKIYTFRRNLKPRVKREMASKLNLPEAFDEYAKITVRLDNQ